MGLGVCVGCDALSAGRGPRVLCQISGKLKLNSSGNPHIIAHLFFLYFFLLKII